MEISRIKIGANIYPIKDTNTTYRFSINGTSNGDTANGVNLGAIYAPISAGTSGQYLKSSGSGAPVWATIDLSGKANASDLEALIDRISVPTLSSAPTSSTLTYTSNGSTKSFYIDQRCKVKDTTNGPAEQNYWTYYYLCDIVNGVAYWCAEETTTSSEEPSQPEEPVGGTKSYVLLASVPTVANLSSVLSTNPTKPSGAQTLETPTLTRPTLLYLVYPLEWEVVQNNQLIKPVILDSNGWEQGAFNDESTPTLTINGKTYRVLDVELGVDNYTIEF